ncbi:MAG: uS2 family ribosomal protein, partial [Bacteroidales bacterium]|nr:uS2 family ribosomal protein [Bacteroidales bacterium]
NIPTLAMVDTNTNPELIDFPIPANDDASKSIDIILQEVIAAIEEGLAERKYDKEQQKEDEEADEQERLAVEGMDEEEAGEGKKKPAARKKAEGEEGAAEESEKKERRPRKVASTGAQKVTKK